MEYDLYQEKIILYGAGYAGLHFCDLLIEHSIEPLFIIDKDQTKWGLKWQGIQILGSEMIAYDKKDSLVIICMLRNDEITEKIKELLLSLGFSKVIHMLEVQVDERYQNMFDHENLILFPNKRLINSLCAEISCVRECLDDEGIKIYNQIIDSISDGFNSKVSSLPIDEQYWNYSLFSHNENEVVYDVGAFNGTVLGFFKKANQDLFSRYYAFEPDPQNYKRIFTDDDRVCIVPYAVSDSFGETVIGKNYMNSNSIILSPSMHYYEDGLFDTTTITLDECNYEKPTFIKIDVEGYEEKVLKGSKELLNDCRPIVACAMYHSITQLVTVPRLIVALTGDDYFFTIRSYMNINETIFYAVPKERML